MPLRQADKQSTKRFEDGEDWLVLRVELSKGEADAVRDISAAYTMDQAPTDSTAAHFQIQSLTAEANRSLFGILCKSWSLQEEDGTPIPPTPEAYDDLNQESGEWVDDCIGEVLRERRERAEKKARSSTKPSERVRSSARAGRQSSTAKKSS